MNELTVQELLDWWLTIKDKTKVVKSTDDCGNESSLYIGGEGDTTVFLGQCYED